MTKNTKDKEEKDFKIYEDLLIEKMKAAYSQMGKLGGLARAKQMAEQGFKMKSERKEKKLISKKNINKGD